jgi:hypothetical protein
MRRVIASVRIATARAAVLLSGALACASVVLPGAPVRAAETYTRETLDRYFRLEWSKSGRNVNGYVYNSSNRRAAHMQLLVEGLDAAGTVVTKTMTWVRDVPPNNRAFFEVAMPNAPSYRVSVLSFDWVEDRLDRRKAW